MRILITGGFGYLGGRLARHLASDVGNEIVLGSRLKVLPPPWLPQAAVAQIRWDSASDLARVCAEVDAIVHLAGMNAQDCAAEPVAALDVNAVATARLLREAAKSGIRRFVYVSTAHVYGNPLVGSISESTCPIGLHPYASSHRAAEDVVRWAHGNGETSGVVIRLSNAFGAPVHRAANCWMLLVNDLCRQAAETKRMVLQSSGMQRRDFIAMTDACNAIRHLLNMPPGMLGDGVFNVGGAWSPTILEMAERVAGRFEVVTGINPEILRKSDSGDKPAELLDYCIEKLTGTGFRPRGNLDVDTELDALIRYVLNSHAASR